MKTKKKSFDYFEALVNMSLYALEEAKLLKDILSDFKPEALEEQRARMHELEHRCDMEKHDMTTALVKEFLPPIERDDTTPFVDLIIECCENVVRLLKEFKNFKKSDKLKGFVITLNDLEEKGDRLYVEAVRKLSREAESTREVIEWRDVYRNFENCYDAAESIADNIESAVMKNT